MNEFLAEMLRTMLFVLMGGPVVANVVLKGTKGNNPGLIMITTGRALAVFVGVVVAAPYRGAHLNPAATVGLAGKFSWAKVGYYIAFQMVGASIGTFLVRTRYKEKFDITEERGAQLSAFCTSPATRNLTINLLCEGLGTLALVFVILYMAGPTLGDFRQTPIVMGSLGAIPAAFLVWVIGLSLGGTTGFAINYARHLAPNLMHSILPIEGKSGGDWFYSWVPILGLLAGAATSLLHRTIS